MSSDSKAKEIFLAAIEIANKNERKALVGQACGHDQPLRDQVERLIEAHFEADSLLDNPRIVERVQDKHELSPPETLPAQTVRSGVQIGPYKLLEQIGSGGMGVVYMAEQVKPIRRKVAVKIIKPGMDTAQVIARFEAERQALAMMDHPNIAHVLDAGTTEFQRPYFVMELVRGIPITDYCDKNKLTTQDRLKLFATVCQAVQHAHTKGIIHRDLKPSNILVTLHDGVPVPKIIDFGVAKATNQQLTDRTLFTSINQFVGTPLYMSPEQAELSGLDVDTRSDIYSLGVLLYELLTGTTPFDRQRLHEAGLDEVRRIIREEEPQKPSTRVSSMGNSNATVSASRGTDPTRLTQSLRNELDWIVMKTLEKDRTRRYETASGLAAEIHRYLNGETVEACPPSTAYRVRKFIHRHRVPVGVATAFGLVIIGSSMLAWWLYGDARRSRDKALVAQKQSIAERDRAREAEQAAASNLDLATREKTRADEKSTELKQRLYNYNILKADAAYRENQLDVAQALLADCVEEQRGWEWRYLQRITGGRRTIRVANETIMEFALTRDGQRALIMDQEGMASLIRMNDGTPLWATKTKIPVSWGIAFAPDEKTVLLGGHNAMGDNKKDQSVFGTIHLLDTIDGKTLWEHPIPDCMHSFPKFSPDGSRILTTVVFSTAKKCEIQVRLASDGTVLQSSPAKMTSQAIFDGTGDRIIVAESSEQSPQGRSTIRCISAKDSSPLWSIDRPAESSGITLSPDGTELVGGGSNHALVIWDVRTGEAKQRIEGPITEPSFLGRFCYDGGRLLTVGFAGQCVVWDWKTKKPVELLGKIARDSFALNLTPDGMRLAYADATRNALHVRSVSPLATTLQLLGHRSGFKGAEFADRETVVSAGPEGTIRIWNPATGQELKTIPTATTCLEVAGSRDGKLVATASTKGVKLWNRANGTAIHQWPDMDETWFIRFTKQSQVLAATGMKGIINLWSTENGSELHSLQLKSRVFGFAISEDATQVVALTLPGCELTHWNTVSDSKTILREASHNNLHGRTVEMSKNGKWVAAGVDNTVEIWDLEKRQLYAKLAGFNGPTMSLTMDSKAERLFAGTQDGMIQVWNIEAKELLLSLKAHDSMVVCLALSPDDATLLSSSYGGELKLWESVDVEYPVQQQRALVQKATDLVNRQFAKKRSAREIVTQLASDTSIDNPDLLNTAIVIANARAASPVVAQAYVETTATKKQRQLRSIQEHLADAAQVLQEQIETAIGENLNPLSELDDKRLDPGRWHSMARQLAETPTLASSVASADQFALLLDALVADPKAPHYLVYLKGMNHARLVQWDQAELYFTRALRLVPRKSKYWYEYAYRLAFLRAYLEKWDAYHELCATALEDFGDNADEKLAERMSKMCLFSSKISVDLNLASGLADRAWANRKDAAILHWTELAVGIADLRREKYETAMKHFESSIAGLSKIETMQVKIQIATVQFYLSIAYKKIGRDDDAQRSFDEASKVLESFPERSTVWNDWMNAKLVFVEAKTVLHASRLSLGING